MKKTKPSINRLERREVEKKFIPTLKALSSHLNNTGPVTDDFIGYKAPAGTVQDRSGRKWQLQAHAILSKSKMMKKDEVVPMVRKWAIGMKLRVFAKYLIDWSSNK